MKTISTSAWIPLRVSFDYPSGRQKHYCDARDAFIAQAPAAMSQLLPRAKNLLVEIGTPPSDVMNELKARMNLIIRETEYEILCWRCDVDVDDGLLAELNPSRNIDSSIVNASAAISFQGALEELLILSELAFPSCIDTTEGIVATAESGAYGVEAKASLFALKYHEVPDPWPKLLDVSLEQTVDWVANTSFLQNAIPTTRVERALASFTHVISLTQHRAGEVLFRAMQGLEAFYCDGTGDLRRQLGEKSAIWLGPWSDKANIVGKLYDQRSKFIHGAGPIEYATRHLDSWEEDAKSMGYFSDAVEFSTRILIATLQRCVLEKVFDVQWYQAVATSSVPTRVSESRNSRSED